MTGAKPAISPIALFQKRNEHIYMYLISRVRVFFLKAKCLVVPDRLPVEGLLSVFCIMGLIKNARRLSDADYRFNSVTFCSRQFSAVLPTQ